MSWQTVDPKQKLTAMVDMEGGWVNAHAHIDRSYIINDNNWARTNDELATKWDLTDEYKRSASVEEILGHMSMAVEHLLEQGGQALGSFIDCDSVVRDKSLRAAERLKERYGEELDLIFMSQPIKGLSDPEERQWFEYAAGFVDIIGGLPERDGHADPAMDRSEEHFDTIFGLAAEHDKPLHIHVDQHNTPAQTETERAIAKTLEYDYAGRVTLIHCVSLAAHQKPYRERIYAELAEQDMSVISCPTAWIDHRRSEIHTPTHNAITPVDEMVKAGVRVAIGTDNIADIYKPFSDGDMWTELRFLLEATHLYDMKTLAKIATVNGLRALGFAQTETALAA